MTHDAQWSDASYGALRCWQLPPRSSLLPLQDLHNQITTLLMESQGQMQPAFSAGLTQQQQQQQVGALPCGLRAPGRALAAAAAMQQRLEPFEEPKPS